MLGISITLSAQNLPAYLPTDSLAAWWPLDGNGNDLSGNGHNAYQADPNSSPSGASDRYGIINKSMKFDGNDFLNIDHHQDFNSLPITFSYWMKINTYGSAQIISKNLFPHINPPLWFGTDWNGWHIAHSPLGLPNQCEFFYCTDTTQGIFQNYCGAGNYPTINAFDNAWHHFVFVVDTTGSKVYFDGNIAFQQNWVNSGYACGNVVPQIDFVHEVTNSWGIVMGSGYNGFIDDFGIWGRALSGDEISNLFGSIHVFLDADSDCANNELNAIVPGLLVNINPGGYTTTTDLGGNVYFPFPGTPDGQYTATVNTSNTYWVNNCISNIPFTIESGQIVSSVEFGLSNTNPCPAPDVSIICPTIRRCSEHTWPIYVHACNTLGGTGILNNAYVLVQLDEGIIVDPATTPPFTMVGDLYRFEIGNLNLGQCVTIIINANFSCDLELGETLCMEATLYPVPECTQDNTPPPGPCQLAWDQSSISVDGWCDENSNTVYFTVSNSGDSMVCSSEVRVYLDNALYATYYIQLGAETDTTFSFASNGGTWILQADQHPLHPGNSHPNDHVEGCGDLPGGDGVDNDGDGDENDDDEWIPGIVDNYHCGDESPFVDVFCGEVVGSFDPNDKKGYPDGIGDIHQIQPNMQMQYLIRFQNTGTAPAYNVVIRDTLDSDLDISSVVCGAFSHNYTFSIYGQRILQWSFNNIMLPDSGTNEEASHGFVTFTINQNPDLPDGTQLTNSAAIYFDSNDPIITNTTLHTINCCIYTSANSNSQIKSNSIFNGTLFPNPSSGQFKIFHNAVNQEDIRIRITDVMGRVKREDHRSLSEGNNTITYNISDFAAGVYLIHISSGREQQVFKLVKE